MSNLDQIIVPSGWKKESVGSSSATFTNENARLELLVRAVYHDKKSLKNRKPSHYVIELQKNWFSKGFVGDRVIAAKANSLEEAVSVAEEFMQEFSSSIKDVPVEEVQAVHNSVPDNSQAEKILTAEVAADALVDAAGYSDELLLSVLRAETNGQYLWVAHRDGGSVNSIAGDENALSANLKLQSIQAIFPADQSGIDAIPNQQLPISVVVHLRNLTVYRFIFSKAHETYVVLSGGTQVTSPEFETTILQILEKKWQ